jgi:hypothetical protein
MNSVKWLLTAFCASMIVLSGTAIAQDKKPIYAQKSSKTGSAFIPKKLDGAQQKQVEPDLTKRMEIIKAQNAIHSDLAAQERKQIVADKVQRMMNDRQQYIAEQRAAANAVAQGRGKAATKGAVKAPVYNTPAKKKTGEGFKIFNFGKKD